MFKRRRQRILRQQLQILQQIIRWNGITSLNDVFALRDLFVIELEFSGSGSREQRASMINLGWLRYLEMNSTWTVEVTPLGREVDRRWQAVCRLFRNHRTRRLA